jgi:hypothetical protein
MEWILVLKLGAGLKEAYLRDRDGGDENNLVTLLFLS